MNGKHKFHKPTSPAFHSGEIWYATDGSGIHVSIIGVTKYQFKKLENNISDYRVDYLQSDGTTFSKDAWNFQVRYFHQADKDL